jgi:hypothetical protein
VKFYSNLAGEIHNLTLNPASGYRFKSGPNHTINPETVWSKIGANKFSMVDVETGPKSSPRWLGFSYE